MNPVRYFADILLLLAATIIVSTWWFNHWGGAETVLGFRHIPAVISVQMLWIAWLNASDWFVIYWNEYKDG